MRRMVAIVGPDGSGKTSLSSALVDLLREDGVDACHEWLGAESYLMAPIRKALRRWWRKPATCSSTQPPTYSDEVDNKNLLVRRYVWATRLYLAAVLFDYRIQLWAKFARTRGRQVLVADRYLFDVVVNIGLVLGWSPDMTVELAQRLISKLPLPQVRIFLRVEPEVSMQRKDDIPDINYVRLRFQYYEAISRAFGFVTLDGTRPIEENAAWLRKHLYGKFAEPHVHYVHANNRDVGGADLVLVNMAMHMRSPEYGYRTTVSLRLATTSAGAHARVGTPVMLAPFVRPQVAAGVRALVRSVAGTLPALWHFWHLFGRERPDIVHVNDLYDFLPAIVARWRRIPVVYHLRMIKTGVVMSGFQWLLPRISNAVVSVSDAVLRAYDPVEAQRDRFLVIHDLGNPALVDYTGDVTKCNDRPAELLRGERLVVMVGRFEEWKGQHVFLQAVRLLPDDLRRRHMFALIGGGVPGHSDYLDAVSIEASRLDVVCLGTRNDVPQILLAADISVHCSVAPDPFPGVVIESMLAGVATIAANAGGVTEMIDSPDVGVLYAPGNAAELSHHLKRLLEQAATPRAVYSVPARSRALRLVDAKTVDLQIDELYCRLLGRSQVHGYLLDQNDQDTIDGTS